MGGRRYRPEDINTLRVVIKQLGGENPRITHGQIAEELNKRGYLRPTGTQFRRDDVSSFLYNHPVFGKNANERKSRSWAPREAQKAEDIQVAEVILSSKLQDAEKSKLLKSLFS